MLSFEDPNADYSFDILCFWATEDGRVFTASDSGCSCPSPFEDYTGATLDEILPKLERVGSIAQAERTFDAWNKQYNRAYFTGTGERQEVAEFVRKHLAKFNK